MGTLAALLKQRGHDVSGSDQHVYPPMSDFLRAEGIRLLEGYQDAHVAGPLDLVVVGNAISRGNPELEAVLDRRVRYCSLPEAIRDFFLWGTRSVVVAGTHGKTTTTSLAGWLLTHAGVDPGMLVGGIARNFGSGGASYRLGQGQVFVIEGDEYDSAFFDKTAKFLKYVPSIAIVNNIEFDHADIYADLDAVRVAFRRLVNLVPRSGVTLLGIDSPEAAALAPLVRSRIQTFGLAEGADWRAVDIAFETSQADAPDALNRTRTRFRLLREGAEAGEIEVPLAGVHNVRNTLAALAAAAELGVPLDTLRRGLLEFQGVKRRLEVVGERQGVTVYDDFAHHPTAVAETLRAVRAAVPGRRLWAIFEPRSASSCRRVFQQDFAQAFAAADEVVIATVYRSTLPDSERLSEAQLVADLAATGVAARHLPDVDTIVARRRGRGASGRRRGGDVQRGLRWHSREAPAGLVMKVRLAGDTLLMADYEPAVDPTVNARVIGLSNALRNRRIDGVRDVVPGYCSLGIHFDPLRTDLAALEHAVRAEAAAIEAAGTLPESRTIEIPVNYGGADGPDLEDVARFAGFTTRQVIDLHASTPYRVYMLGFVPGFAYLGRVPSAIAAPRHRRPRERVPAGSVGIAGQQTGVYPIETPGGWQLMGRTAAVMFDPSRSPASLLTPGDMVRFVPA